MSSSSSLQFLSVALLGIASVSSVALASDAEEARLWTRIEAIAPQRYNIGAQSENRPSSTGDSYQQAVVVSQTVRATLLSQLFLFNRYLQILREKTCAPDQQTCTKQKLERLAITQAHLALTNLRLSQTASNKTEACRLSAQAADDRAQLAQTLSHVRLQHAVVSAASEAVSERGNCLVNVAPSAQNVESMVRSAVDESMVVEVGRQVGELKDNVRASIAPLTALGRKTEDLANQALALAQDSNQLRTDATNAEINFRMAFEDKLNLAGRITKLKNGLARLGDGTTQNAGVSQGTACVEPDAQNAFLPEELNAAERSLLGCKASLQNSTAQFLENCPVSSSFNAYLNGQTTVQAATADVAHCAAEKLDLRNTQQIAFEAAAFSKSLEHFFGCWWPQRFECKDYE